MSDKPLRIKVIGCPVFYREFCMLAGRSSHVVDLQFLDAELHGLSSQQTLAAIQSAVDAASAEKKYDAIVVGYGRCNGGVGGLKARDVPLVVPKMHDCIAMFLGSRDRYLQFFSEHPGTYYLTSGWMERNMKGSDQLEMPLLRDGDNSSNIAAGIGREYELMVEKYGADNAEYLRDFFSRWKENYTRLAYIKMDVCNESGLIDRAKGIARGENWRFELVDGDWSLMERLFSGKWDGDFVTIPPGGTLCLVDNSDILAAK